MTLPHVERRRGFTLIELLIVIAIIGILAAIAIPNFLRYRTQTYNTAAENDARIFFDTAMAYFGDTSTSGTVIDSNGSPEFNASRGVRISGGPMTDNGETVAFQTPMFFYHSVPGAATYQLRVNGSTSRSN